ncbi:GNAT family N-acetyltransferase [Methylocystis echinoides]|uniref:GNAT family N-acetyltransferase n=1 Tax=Methylocystis echinoides TaxID=29468 RepID=UPI003418CCC3
MGQSAGFAKAAAPFLRGSRLAGVFVGWSRGFGRAAQSAPHVATGAWFLPKPVAFQAVELSPQAIEDARADWSALAQGALEPSPFFEHGFALAAARHLPPDDRPRFIALRNMHGDLAAIFPLAPTGLSGADGLVRVWRGDLTALATPLVLRDQAPETLVAFLDWAAAASPAAGALFPRVPLGGAFHTALVDAATRRGRRIEILESFARAALTPGGSADEKCRQAGGLKKVNDIRRTQRRLAERGAVEFGIVADAGAARAAVEEFLALEASGWKAGRGAFLSEPARATFLRSATRLLAVDGLCKIAALRLDGRAIAMAILLQSQNRSYCWKMAIDDGLRALAPGVQLAHALAALQLARPEIELTDSCAIARHPMIGRLWPDRVALCDIAVSLRDEGFEAALRREQRRRRVREFAKRAANRLLKRKVS